MYPPQEETQNSPPVNTGSSTSNDSDQGHPQKTPPALGMLRTQVQTLASIDTALESKRKFHLVCRDKEHGLRGYVPDPFWADLPYTDIHMSITPDVLHQLYSGVFAHLLSWCRDSISEKELDERVKRLPPSYGIRHFNKDFSVRLKANSFD